MCHLLSKISHHVLFFALGAVVLIGCQNDPTENLTQYVDPMIGTGVYSQSGAMGESNTFPGPSLPHGMVQLSPDTGPHLAGYLAEDDSIEGFSHTHVTGTGCRGFGNFLTMPTTGPVAITEEEYRSSFSSSTEQAEPGYYKVMLEDYDIVTELTATTRTGLHQYTFPESDSAHILLDVTHNLADPKDDPIDATVHIVDDQTLEGSVTIPRPFCGGMTPYTLYFSAKVSKPFASSMLWSRGDLQKANSVEGTDIGAVLNYSTTQDEQILLKLGISYVSIEQAALNLREEMPGWNFDETRSQAREAWNQKLNVIQVEGGSREDNVKFYTALYHAMLGPYTTSDVNGKYRGMDDKIHTAEGRTQYHFFSLWDTFRSLHPLLILTEPDVQNGLMTSLIHKQQEGGWLPQWEFANRYTNCMIADHATSVIAESIVKGVDDFDLEKAYYAMRKNATRMPRDGTIDVLHNDGITPLQIGEDAARVVWKAVGRENTLQFDWKWRYNDNQYHHYVLSYDAEAGVTVYIDNEQVASSDALPGSLSAGEDLFTLGVHPDAVEAGKFFTGNLDNIHIYNSAVGQDQIETLANREVADGQSALYANSFNAADDLEDGHLTGEPVFEDGKFDQAIAFDGIDDQVEIEPGELGDSFTISFWIRTSLPTDSQGRTGLNYYINDGYIPADIDWRGWSSVSTTIEDAYNDYALAQAAKILGKQEDYRYFLDRAKNYQNVFDPGTGFMRPKLQDGSWKEPFKPTDWDEFTEGNAWSYSWFVPHDVAGLIDGMGRERFIERLDHLFAEYAYPKWNEPFTHYWHGNEPSQQAPYLYNFVGQPWKTQQVTRGIMDSLYATTPNGIPGNEDVGQLSAWFALSAMGFHPVAPAQGTYMLGSPLFDKVTIRLDKKYYDASEFTLIADNNSKDNKYIQQVTFDGEEVQRVWFDHSMIQQGGVIRLQMGPEPNKKLGVDTQYYPPSISMGEELQ